jgi:hypothetical protein
MDLKHPHSYNLPTLTMVIERPLSNQKPLTKARKYGKQAVKKDLKE